MQFSAADTASMLTAMGQIITLAHRSHRFSAIGIIDYEVDPIRFLEQGKAIPACVAIVSQDLARRINTDWTIYIGAEARPVLEVVDDRSGLVNVYLGEPKTC